MADWTKDELDCISASDELEIAAVAPDGSQRRARPVWVVRVGDDLYVRAAYGSGSTWHQVAQTSGRAHVASGGVEKDVTVEAAAGAVNDQVDAAYRAKYGDRYARIVEDITDAEHRESTLRLLPAEGES